MTAPTITRGQQRFIAATSTALAAELLVDQAQTDQLIDGLDAAVVRAGIAAALEERTRTVTPRRLDLCRVLRKRALEALAELRHRWQPHEVATLLRAVAVDGHPTAAWTLLVESVEMIVGIEDGSIDAVAVLGPRVPGSVQDKRQLLVCDAEGDAAAALAQMLGATPQQARVSA